MLTDPKNLNKNLFIALVVYNVNIIIIHVHVLPILFITYLSIVLLFILCLIHVNTGLSFLIQNFFKITYLSINR